MGKVRFYGKALPGLTESALNGTLIVVEGGDGSGRTTQAGLLKDWLEGLGYPTSVVELKGSLVVGQELEEAMQGHQLCPITLALFYATDFVDQLEKTIIPALRAGFVVIADRYIYTLLARAAVRGIDVAWLKSVYGVALVPDLIFYLRVAPRILAERSLRKYGWLDYWESGMDIQRSGDFYENFIRYQSHVQEEFQRLGSEYGLQVINANRDPFKIQDDIRARVQKALRPRAVKTGRV